MKILNFGSLNIDHVYEVPHFPLPGETISSARYSRFPGGKGLNQSIAMAKAGADVYHAGKLGQNSEFLLEALKESSVNTSLLDTTGSETGQAIIQVNPEGENCILLYGGSNQEITTEYIDRVFAFLTEDSILVLQNEINNLEYILGKARERGLKIALNPSPVDERLKSMDLSGITWLLLNEIESRELSGFEEPDSSLMNLLNCYPHMKIILTLGEKGAIYQDKNTRYVQPAYKTRVKDTTAAGDTFTGYFISLTASGLGIEEALDMAARAAAITISREGAGSSIPKLEEVKRAMQGKEKAVNIDM